MRNGRKHSIAIQAARTVSKPDSAMKLASRAVAGAVHQILKGAARHEMSVYRSSNPDKPFGCSDSFFSCVSCISWLRESFLGAFASLREVNYVTLGNFRCRDETIQLTEHQEHSWPLPGCL